MRAASNNFKALLRGYALFRVNGAYYVLYSRAQAARKAVPEGESVQFDGFSLLRGWRGFYRRIYPANMVVNPTVYSGAGAGCATDRWHLREWSAEL